MFKRLFGRQPRDEPDAETVPFSERVHAFWRWFEGRAEDLHARTASGEVDPDEVSAAVAALSPDLAWEFCSGAAEGVEGFALSSEGDVALRLLCEAALRRAPALPGWRFYAAKQHASGAMRLRVGPHELDFAEMRGALEFAPADQVVHVSLFHPVFAELPEDVRSQVVFIALDTALGEDLVESWIGALDSAVEATPDHRHPLEALPGTVRALLTEHEFDPEQKVHERWTTFEMPPERVRTGHFRDDIAFGTTRLVTQFEGERARDLHERLRRAGAALVSLTLPAAGVPNDARMDRRQALLDPVEAALEEAGLGVFVGTGFAIERDYGDFLVFDRDHALDVTRRVLEGLPEFAGVEWHELDPTLRSAPTLLSTR